MVLLGLTALSYVAASAADWNTYLVVQDYLDGAGTDADLERADLLSLTVALSGGALAIASAIVFLVWLWRARQNSELLCFTQHRHSRGWVIGSWFCPIVNLWWPKQVVDDVMRASDPRQPCTRQTFRGGGLKAIAISHLWWWSWLISWIGDRILLRTSGSDPTVDSLRTVALGGAATAALGVFAAACLVLIIRRITAWQTQPRQPAPPPWVAAPTP